MNRILLVKHNTQKEYYPAVILFLVNNPLKHHLEVEIHKVYFFAPLFYSLYIFISLWLLGPRHPREERDGVHRNPGALSTQGSRQNVQFCKY